MCDVQTIQHYHKVTRENIDAQLEFGKALSQYFQELGILIGNGNNGGSAPSSVEVKQVVVCESIQES
jgi:hypothetical protein